MKKTFSSLFGITMLCSVAFADTIGPVDIIILPGLGSLTAVILGIVMIFVLKEMFTFIKPKLVRAILIISAIILVLFISLIVGAASGVTGHGMSEVHNYNSLESLTIQGFNAQFEALIGLKQSAKTAREIIDKVNNCNNYNYGPGEVYLKGISDTKAILSEKNYNISIEEYYDNGYVKTIKIVEASNYGSGDL